MFKLTKFKFVLESYKKYRGYCNFYDLSRIRFSNFKIIYSGKVNISLIKTLGGSFVSLDKFCLQVNNYILLNFKQELGEILALVHIYFGYESWCKKKKIKPIFEIEDYLIKISFNDLRDLLVKDSFFNIFLINYFKEKFGLEKFLEILNISLSKSSERV